MKKLFTAADPMEAHLVRGLLEEAGIIADVQGEAIWVARGEIGFGEGTAPYVVVKDEDVDAARAVVAEYEAKRKHVPICCPECEFDLRGSAGPKCPECGWKFDRGPKGEPWTCPSCNQKLGAQFTDCWNCGTQRPWPPTATEA